MPIQKVLDALRENLWFLPAMWVVACGLAAFGMVALGHATPEKASRVPLIFGGGPEAARGLLSAIAASMITVVGVVFSITIVALQLASSQYSPRVLRNFMRDRTSQMTLGSFIGAFIYSLLVLRTVRAEAQGRDEFVPVLAVTGAVALSVVALSTLVYFIHHIATRMQVSYITAAVARETLREIDRQAAVVDGARSARGRLPGERGLLVRADESGYLQYVEREALAGLALQHDLVIRVVVAPGAWVQRQAPLFEVWVDHPDGVDAKLRARVSVGDERVVFRDPEFGVQQLVDIAVKALSPGINDPTTARNAIHRIVEILVAAGRTDLGPIQHVDDDGRLRVVVPSAEFGDLVTVAFAEITHFARGIPAVVQSIGEAFDTLESTLGDAPRADLGRIAASLGVKRSSPRDAS